MDIQGKDAGGQATVIPFPKCSPARKNPVSVQDRNKALAEWALKRLDFERRVQGGGMSDEEIVTESACLSVELFKTAADLDL